MVTRCIDLLYQPRGLIAASLLRVVLGIQLVMLLIGQAG